MHSDAVSGAMGLADSLGFGDEMKKLKDQAEQGVNQMEKGLANPEDMIK